MPSRRILSLWFPRLTAERVLRAEPQLAAQPLAVTVDRRGALVLASLSVAAETAGLRRGMALGDARAICPELVTRAADGPREAAFLAALRRWAGRFSPWVAEEAAEDGTGALVLDVTGCAHLFGGEEGMADEVEAEAASFGLSLRLGLADTLGAAWAVARFGAAGGWAAHAGDAIDQEARATRSRASKRRWERGGQPPEAAAVAGAGRIVAQGGTIAHLGPLPVAALRLEPAEVAALQ
jgi:protein ImuB